MHTNLLYTATRNDEKKITLCLDTPIPHFFNMHENEEQIRMQNTSYMSTNMDFDIKDMNFPYLIPTLILICDAIPCISTCGKIYGEDLWHEYEQFLF